MAEATVLVCDVCGKPATESVTFRANGRNRVKDFCAMHLASLLEGSRAPKRGRRPGSVNSSARKSTAKRTAARRRPKAKAK